LDDEGLRMNHRRRLLATSAAVTAVLLAWGLWPRSAVAQTPGRGAFEATSVADALKALGLPMPQPSREVSVTGPDLSEDGAQVPVTLSTSLAGVRRLLLLIEKNPAVLSAVFDLTEMVEPAFSLRVKMNESCDVYAVAVLADGRALYARKEIQVTIGGCAG
jgi:sulfur-oxidizing protein SoxY